MAGLLTDSLARRNGHDQEPAKAMVFDLQINSASPELSIHTLDRERDRNCRSVRVRGDLRLIAHRTEVSPSPQCADHHAGEVKRVMKVFKL